MSYIWWCIQISQEADQVVWYSHLFQNFPQFIVIHTVTGFGIVNKAAVHVFLELGEQPQVIWAALYGGPIGKNQGKVASNRQIGTRLSVQTESWQHPCEWTWEQIPPEEPQLTWLPQPVRHCRSVRSTQLNCVKIPESQKPWGVKHVSSEDTRFGSNVVYASVFLSDTWQY